MKRFILKQGNRLHLIVLLCILTLVPSMSGAGSAYAAASFGNDPPPSFSSLFEQINRAVVNISTTQVVEGGANMEQFMGPDSPFRDFFGDEFFKRFFGDIPRGEMKTHSLGSGFIIDNEGFILTNSHVVQKATEIKVKLETGKEYDAKVIGTDPKTDVALIQVKTDAEFPKPVPLGNSEGMKVGDWVMAIGNPFGLGHTATVGIVSAKGRVIGAGPYDDFIQTDAAINPGNSGGPLFNMNGEVIGINTAIVAQGQGIGFAIPINVAKEILPQLRTGKVIRGWLGVAIQDVTPDLARSFNLQSDKGVLVADVMSGTPAEKAGLQRGDIITQVDGKAVQNAHDLSRTVAGIKPDTVVPLTVLRGGETKTVQVTIGTMPEKEERAAVEPGRKESPWGLTVQNLTPQLAQRYGIEDGETGVVVTDIRPGSPAADSQLRRGDVIQEVNRQRVDGIDSFMKVMSGVSPDQNLLLLVKRGERTFFMSIKPQTGGDRSGGGGSQSQ